MPRKASDVKVRERPKRNASYDTLIKIVDDLQSDLSVMIRDREETHPRLAKLEAELDSWKDSTKQWKSEAERLEKALAQERSDSNSLRDRLMQAERLVERLVERHRGYIEGLEDAQPPPMVPLTRDPAYTDWRGVDHTPMDYPTDSYGNRNFERRDRREWWHR